MTRSWLTLSSALRMTVALGICVILVALVLLVEHPLSAAETKEIIVSDLPVLTLSSTAPVVTWHVTVGEQNVASSEHDRWHWQGTLDAAPGTVIRIRAELADGSPNDRALRARIASLPERLVWSTGNPSLILTMPAY